MCAVVFIKLLPSEKVLSYFTCAAKKTHIEHRVRHHFRVAKSVAETEIIMCEDERKRAVSVTTYQYTTSQNRRPHLERQTTVCTATRSEQR